MKKVIYSQVLAENGITNFSGLYDENGLPVNVELEVNEDGVVMTIMHKELRTCSHRRLSNKCK